MGMVAVAIAGVPGDLSLSHEVVSRLSRLGVTQAAVTADEFGLVIILEGRTFDPSTLLGPALAALGADRAERVLRPVAQLVLEGG